MTTASSSLDRGGTGPSTADDPTRPIDHAPTPPGATAGEYELGSGSTIGRYIVLGSLGRGGMGSVYEAFDRTLDRRVAIKRLHLGVEPREEQRLIREAQALAQLSHPNVVQVYEVGRDEGRTFIAMELVGGTTLRRWARAHPDATWREHVGLYLQAAEGLCAAHARGLVHRDFKPSNAVVDDEGRVKVLDFGLARAASESDEERSGSSISSTELELEHPASSSITGAPLTEAGVVLGTPAYMPPEQMADRGVDARSDQFSLCVALYEAVYGRRPFQGRSLQELGRAITLAELDLPPSHAKIPAALLAVLRRGLAARPDERWPSMDELAERLRRLSEPRRGRAAMMGLAGLLLVGGTAAGYVAGAADAEPRDSMTQCTEASERLRGIWDEARAQQTREALLETELSYATETWERVDAGLSAYAERWAEEHTAACRATRVTGEQSEAGLELRMACLRDRRAALEGTVAVLAEADASVVRRATGIVARLPSLSACSDPEKIRAAAPLPEDPEVAAATTEIRRALAAVRATTHAGRDSEALAQLEPLAERADALGYGPLRAELLVARGRLRGVLGEIDAAERDLHDAYLLALSNDFGRAELDAVDGLVFVVGDRQRRLDAVARWEEEARARIERPGVEDRARASVLDTLGNLLLDRGELAQAREHLERSVTLQERAHGPDHPLLAASLHNLGNVRFAQEELDEAEAAYQRARVIWERAHGPGHPDLAAAWLSLGNVASRQGQPERAQELYEKALAIQERTIGSEHVDVATTLSNIGVMLRRRGRLGAAHERYEQALAIRERVLGPEHPEVAVLLSNLSIVAMGRGQLEDAERLQTRALEIIERALGAEHYHTAHAYAALGNVLSARGEHERALELYERALGITEAALGAEHPRVAIVHDNMGATLLSASRYPEAQEHFEIALQRWLELRGPEHPDTSHSYVGLAEVALGTGDPGRARELAEHALAIRSQEQVGAASVAEARFLLARALWSSPDQRRRARTLAEQAASGFEGVDAEELAEVRAWLEAPSAP